MHWPKTPTCTRRSMRSRTSSTGVCASTRKKSPITTPPKHRRARASEGRGGPRRGRTRMRLIILSGLSGAGKSVALHMLEDLGYYCIDNIPAALLKAFISHTVRSGERVYERTAIGLDARNTDAEIALVPALVDELRRSGIECEILFLVASEEELLRRFAETRP